MKHQATANVLLSVTLLAAMSGMASGQQCPDWSPLFNQIDDSVGLQQLQSQRSEGWPSLNPQTNGGISIQQGIQGLDQIIQQYQQVLRQSQQAWTQVRANNAPMPNVTGDQCRSRTDSSAAMATACEADNARNAILAAEGTEDLARCRAGLPAGSYTSLNSMGSGVSSPGGGFGGGSSPYEQGASSVADMNVGKRAGMVNAVKRTWQPPAEQQSARVSLAQNTTLADPFAAPDSNGSAAGSSSSVANIDPPGSDDSVTSANATSSSQWSDPLADDSAAGNHAAPSTDVATAAPSQAEIREALDAGTVNTTESSVTPVAQVLEASNWNEFANVDSNSPQPSSSDSLPSAADSSAPSQSGVSAFFDPGSSSVITPGSPSSDNSNTLLDLETARLQDINNNFNENLASRYVTDQGLQQAGAQFQQGFKPIDDATATGIFSTDGNAGYNAIAVQQFNFDSNSLGVASVEAVLPGSKYLQAIPNDLPAWQQTFQKVGGTIKTSVQSFYNRITGAPDCTQSFSQLVDSECAK